MPACSVKGCKNRTEFLKKHEPPEKVHFHHFPKNVDCIEKWKAACGRDKINIKNARICSEHFLPSVFRAKSWVHEHYGWSPQHGLRLKDDAVPTEKLPGIINGSPFDVTTSRSMDDSSTLSTHSPPRDDVATRRIEESSADHEIKIWPAMSKDLPTTSVMRTDAEEEAEERESGEKRTWEEKYERLKKENGRLEQKLRTKDKKILKAERAADKYLAVLKKLFTPGQVRLSLHPQNTKTKWNPGDIAAAVSLRCVSPKAYRFLRNSSQIPLPSLSTFRKSLDKFDMEQGPMRTENSPRRNIPSYGS